ncbi:MAG: DNA-binding protein [Candidatus Thorarchaeota archaeon]
MSDEELNELRRRKMAQLQQQAQAEEQAVQEAEIRAQRAAILRQILSPEARSRLSNLRMVKPHFAEQLENDLIRLASANRLPELPITDKTLKTMLAQLAGRQRDTKIQFK